MAYARADIMPEYLRPTAIIDSDHPSVVEFARASAGEANGVTEKAVRLYYAVRDGIRYDPYTIDFSVEGLRASTTLANGRGWCVTKAVLLAGCCRAMGIPARLGFADVRNHLSTARMRERMQTDVFLWHGYTSIHLNGIWVKATPAFDIRLCERLRLKPLEFDGSNDAVYHPFDLAGNRHMEYVRDRGEYADVPADRIAGDFRRQYPEFSDLGGADFEREIDQETSAD